MRDRELKERKLALLKKMKPIMESLNAARRAKLANRPGAGLARLLEGELERAQLTLSAQDVVNKLQETAEDLAKMSVEQLLPLADEMKGEFGPEAANKFEEVVGGALESALQAVRDAREQVNNAVLRMQGKLSDEDVNTPDTDMANMTDEPADNIGLDAGEDKLGLELSGAGEEDEFGGADAASGPEGEPLGRAKKESFIYSKKKSKINESKHNAALLEAFSELSQKDTVDSLVLEVVADKYGVCEEELFSLYTTANHLLNETDSNERLDEFLPLLAPLLGAAARGAAGVGAKALGGAATKALGGAATKALGGAATKALGSQLTKALGGPAAKGLASAAASMLGGDDEDDDTVASRGNYGASTAKKTPVQIAKQQQQAQKAIASNPKLRNLAPKFRVTPKDLADLGSAFLLQNSCKNKSKPLNEHRIVEEMTPVNRDDALRIVKERLKAVKTGRDMAVRETFSSDIQLTTPRAVVNQLSCKYGDPAGWSVARTDEGSYYVLSAPIPETEKAKVLHGEIQGLAEEVKSIREKHADVTAEYQLPQEIKINEIRQRLGEYETGYRHQVAKWLTLDEAAALVSLAQEFAPKKKGK